MPKPDPLSWTLLFKKHKTTVLLMLPPHESITTAKDALIKALRSRGLSEINGHPIPDDPSEIEFGVAVDKNDLEKGWTRLEVEMAESENKEASKRGARKKSSGEVSLQAADLRNGQPIAFRFRKLNEQARSNDELDLDLGLEDPGWDVVVPSLDDDEEEE